MALTPSVSQQQQNKKKRSSISKAKEKAAAAAKAAAAGDNSNNNTMNMNEQFLINRGGINGGAVLQIRTPNPNDVLSGRGGSVNAHPGNIQFREWVSHRRVDYNLAHSKNDKADICREIIAQVEALGGRFLGRDNPSSPFWVELDEERIMAKTSQALREGAPKIRLEHRDDGHTTTSTVVSSSTKRRRSSNNTAARASSKPEAQAEPQQQQQQRDDEPRAEQKRVRVDYNGHIVRPNQASPPLGAQPSPDQLLDNTEDHTDRDAEVLLPIMFPTRSGDEKVHRENSLACSDISGFSECFSDLAEPFVDPFENETSELLLFQHPHHHDALESRNSDPSLRLLSPRNLPSPPPPRLGVTRDTSSSNNHSYSSSNSDNGGLGALTQQQQQSLNQSDSSSLYKFLADINNTNNNNHGVRPVFPLHHLHQPRPSLKRRSSSASNLSSRSSISSVLSDLPDAHRKAAPPADFVEGMTMIHDALHPWKDEFNNGSNNNKNNMSHQVRAKSDKHHHSRLMSGSIAMRRRPASSSSQ